MAPFGLWPGRERPPPGPQRATWYACGVMTGSDPTLLALHGLRLTGLAEAGAVAEIAGADPTTIEVELTALADDDLVVRRDRPPRPGWVLTPAGRARAAELVAAELAASGARSEVEAAYGRFCRLNPQVLAACCRWQVRDPATGTLNRHTAADAAHDRAVLADLGRLDAEAQPVLAALSRALARFGRYGSRLAHALEQARSGETGYVDKPLISSYHTVWFELHEDLLATLGLDRGAETARLAGSGPEPGAGPGPDHGPERGAAPGRKPSAGARAGTAAGGGPTTGP